MRTPLGAVLVPLVSLLAGPCDAPEAPVVEAEATPVGFVEVGLGARDFGCGLRDDGSVRCWGHDVGGGSPAGEFSAISVAEEVACGVLVGGRLVCWTTKSLDLFSPLDGEFSAVGEALWGTCGVRVGGELVCSGGAPTGSVPEGAFVSVSVGFSSACGVRADGAVECWSDRFRGRVVDDGPFVSVDVGESHACGVRASGEAACWAPREVGGLWVSDHGQWSPPAGLFVDVAVSSLFSCGLRVDGEVVCWGAPRPDACADGLGPCAGWAADPIPAGPFVALDVASAVFGGDGSVCGVRPGGELVCWGEGEHHWRPPAGAFVALDVGNGATCGVRAGGEAACWGRRDWSDEVPGGTFAAVSASAAHACGLRPGGEVECWGDNTWGAATPPPGPFTAIDVGGWSYHGRLSCGLHPSGEAACWGDDRGGAANPPPGPFTRIRVWETWQGTAACGLRAGGTAECWGPRWVDVSPEEIVAEVFGVPDFNEPDAFWRESFPGGPFRTIEGADTWYVCGIRPDGPVECWSPHWPPGVGVPDPDAPAAVAGRYQGGAEPVGVPEELEWIDGDLPGGPYVALASGDYHTCGIRSDRTVICFGADARSPDGEFNAIDVGSRTACGIRPSGEMACWHLTRDYEVSVVDLSLAPAESLVALVGRCGLLDTGEFVCPSYQPPGVQRRPGPYEMVTDNGGLVVEYWAAHPSEESLHFCAIDRAGRLHCWGSNDSGQTVLPAPWRDDPPYSDVAAGYAHTCAIGVGGGIVCWGDDRHGQTQSPAGTFTALDAGQWHTCALRSDGEIDCWGDGPAEHDNDYDDPPSDRPSQPPPGPFTALDAGQWHTCALRPDGTASCWLSY